MTHDTKRSRLLVPLFLVTVVALGVESRPAAAGAWFSVGGPFTVGGIRFQVGFHDHDPRWVAPVRYYRVDRPLYAAGARCSDRCYVQGGYHYHHESCPLVRTYLGRHGYSPVRVVPVEPYRRYAPPPYVFYRPARPYRYDYPGHPVYPSYRATPRHDTHRHDHGRHRWDDHHRDRRHGRHPYDHRHR